MTAAPSDESLKRLQDLIGHRFQKPSLLFQALTHASALASNPAGNNERLEFLGDRVLGLVISDSLIKLYPNTDEGGLAPRLNELVRRETCAAVAQEIDLGAVLILAPSESNAGGRQKTAILADACEALIGALYLDGGLEAARAFVERYWSERLANLAHAPQDAKTALQEWSQGKGLAVPDYQIISRTGPDHDPRFIVRVEVKGCDPCEGGGTNKRAAEQAAAEALLFREKIWSPNDAPS